MPQVHQPQPARRFDPAFLLKLMAVRVRYMIGSRLAPANTVAHAARLFCTPFASSRQRAIAASAATASVRHDIPVEGNTIATYVWGDPAAAPYILFAHGWSSFGLRFEPWVARLRAAGFAVVSFDQPSHGHSSGELVTLPEFVATLLGVGRHYGEAAGVVAHSLGGAALTLALGAGLRARRAVLIAPSVDPVAATKRFARMVRLAPHLLESLHEGLAKRTGVSIHALQSAPVLPSLAVPALIVHDRDDAEVPFAEGERYAALWPGAQWLATSGLGHRDLLADPGVMDAVVTFLAAPHHDSQTPRG